MRLPEECSRTAFMQMCEAIFAFGVGFEVRMPACCINFVAFPGELQTCMFVHKSLALPQQASRQPAQKNMCVVSLCFSSQDLELTTCPKLGTKESFWVEMDKNGLPWWTPVDEIRPEFSTCFIEHGADHTPSRGVAEYIPQAEQQQRNTPSKLLNKPRHVGQ